MLNTTMEAGLLHIHVSGKLAEQDYSQFIPMFESMEANSQSTIPILIELAPDFSGWDLGALWRDIKFDMKHMESFSRIAIVGTKKWEEWATKLSKPFLPGAQMKFFKPEERTAAEGWARNDAT